MVFAAVIFAMATVVMGEEKRKLKEKSWAQSERGICHKQTAAFKIRYFCLLQKFLRALLS